MRTYWEANENEYVDVWYYTIIGVLVVLKLIKTPPPLLNLMTSIDVYDQLMRYKK